MARAHDLKHFEQPDIKQIIHHLRPNAIPHMSYARILNNGKMLIEAKINLRVLRSSSKGEKNMDDYSWCASEFRSR